VPKGGHLHIHFNNRLLARPLLSEEMFNFEQESSIGNPDANQIDSGLRRNLKASSPQYRRGRGSRQEIGLNGSDDPQDLVCPFNTVLHDF